jgi:hypothetical protein
MEKKMRRRIEEDIPIFDPEQNKIPIPKPIKQPPASEQGMNRTENSLAYEQIGIVTTILTLLLSMILFRTSPGLSLALTLIAIIESVLITTRIYKRF